MQRLAWEALKKKPESGREELRVEEDEELHALLERAAKLMVKARYRAYSVRIKWLKEKSYGLMESSFYLDMVKGRNPPKKRH